MPGVILLIFITGLSFGLYLFLYHIKRIDWKILKITIVFGVLLTALFATLIFKMEGKRVGWCERFHITTNYPPAETRTAMDYFEKGNYQYDTGDCNGAIESYTKSIELNGKYPESYNNRAYTYMMMEQYDTALVDLNKALELNPNYVNALMNRGDVLGYRKDRREEAIRDYEKIIELTGPTSTAVCAHMADAKYGGKDLFSLLRMVPSVINCRSGK